MLIAWAALATCGGLVRAQPPGDEPTLPPVVVRPSETESPIGPPTELPVERSAGSTTERAATGARPGAPAYPGLSELRLGDGGGAMALDGALKADKSLFDIPSLGTMIDRAALETKQASDAARALQQEVGVLVQQTARGQSSPFIRGLTGQQVLVLIDGVRVNNSTFRAGPNQYFNLVDPGQIERIEVVRGPQTVLWGSDAIGGVVNFVTRRAAQDQGSYRGGSFTEYFSTADLGSYSRGNLEGWSGQTGYFGGASYLNVNDLDRGGALGRQPFTNFDQYAGDLRIDRLLDDDQMLTVSLQHFEQQDLPRSDRFAPFALGPPATTPRPTFFDPQQRDLAYLRLQGLGSNALFDAYSTTAFYARNKEGTRELRSPTRIDFAEFDVDSVGFNLTLARDFDWLGKLTYGGDMTEDQVDAFRRRVNPISGAVTRDNPQFPDDSRYRRGGTFLNWDVTLVPRLDAVAGVRYENADAKGTLSAVSGLRTPFTRNYQAWTSSAGLVFEVDSAVHLVGNVSEGYRAPNLDDLTADNPVLQNAQDLPSLSVQGEHARTYEVGVKIDGPRLRLQAFEFWTELPDSIQRQAVDALGNPLPNVLGPNGTLVPGSGTFIRDNFRAYVNGTELAGEYLLDEGWSAYGNFWYAYGQDLDRNEPLSRIPPTQGVVGLRWRDEDRSVWFDAYLWLVRRQDRYAALNNIDARFPVGGTPGYGTLNFRAGKSWGRCQQHQMTLSLENVTDRAYRVLGSGVDGPGFNAILGYTRQF